SNRDATLLAVRIDSRRSSADGRSRSGRGEISSAQERPATRLHYHRGFAAGYCNAGRRATPVLQTDRRVNSSKKHSGLAVREPERRQSECLFCRGHSGRDPDPLIEDRRSKSHLANIHTAIPEQTEEPRRDRKATWRGPRS